jgi:hypothetical protein
VDIVGESLDSVGKLCRIRDDISRAVAADLPTIVNVDVLVSRIAHSAADHRVCNFADQLLVHLATKLVPAVSAIGGVVARRESTIDSLAETQMKPTIVDLSSDTVTQPTLECVVRWQRQPSGTMSIMKTRL